MKRAFSNRHSERSEESLTEKGAEAVRSGPRFSERRLGPFSVSDPSQAQDDGWGGRRRAIRKLAWMAIVLLAAFATLGIALRLTPMPAGLEAGTIGSTEFLDREGRPLRLLLAEERRYAQRCVLGEVSPQLIGATL